MTPLELQLKKLELLEYWYCITRGYVKICEQTAYLQMEIDAIELKINKKPTAE